MKKNEIQESIEPLLKAFEELDISYYIGGSIASSAYGIARATMDVDLVTDLKENKVDLLVQRLSPNYFVDKDMILDALKNNSSFNLIHLDTMLKIDIFIPSLSEKSFYRKAFERRQKDNISDEPDSLQVYLCSAEDVILSKLKWYKLGGSISERQWNDILGVIKVQEKLLDKEYLFEWSKVIEVHDLLERAIAEARKS